MLKQYLWILRVLCLLVFFIPLSHANSERIAPPLKDLVKKYQQKPNLAAETLEKRTHISLDEKLYGSTTVYVAIRINDPEAADDFSQIDIRFNSYFQDIHLDFANVLADSGKTLSLSKDAMQISSRSTENFYVDTKNLSFSLPLTHPGSIIEFQYTLSTKQPVIEGQFFSTASLTHWEPDAGGKGYQSNYVHFAEIKLSTPKGVNIYDYTPTNFNIKKRVKTQQQNKLYHWTSQKTPEVKSENFLPRDAELVPFVALTTASDWRTIVKWAQGQIEPQVHSSQEVKKIAHQIRLKTADKLEQVEAVFSYMQKNIRYVFAHVGRGGYQPHKTGEIIDKGYGDCKDQTTLSLSLLRELGIEAYPALVATTGASLPIEEIPNSHFDHMITYIPAQNGLEAIWLDTVGGNFLFPGISASVNKQKALVIQDGQNSLTEIQSVKTPKSIIDLAMDIQAGAEKNLLVKLQMGFIGTFESSIRNWLRYGGDRTQAVESLLNDLYPKADVSQINIQNFDHFRSPVTIKAQLEFEYEGTNQKTPYGLGFKVSHVARLFNLIPQLSRPDLRQQDFSYSQSYTINTKLSFEKAKNYKLDSTFGVLQQADNPVYKLKQSWINEENKTTVRQQLLLKSFTADKSLYPAIYKDYKALDKHSLSVGFVYDKNKGEIASLNKSGLNDSQSHIDLVQVLIDDGNYRKAINQAEQSISQYPKLAELVYLKALAHAYNGDDVIAEKLFTQAEELGYEY